VQAPVLAALVTASVSLAIALANMVFNFRQQRHAHALQTERDERIATLTDFFENRSADRSARRDYEHEARKRLYEAAEPLLFQLGERAEDLQARVASLARTARDGHLEPGRGWLTSDGYFLRSTIHRVLAPVALFHRFTSYRIR
jgi:hypothetical protein